MERKSGIRRLFTTLGLLLALVFGLLIYLSFQPQDLGDIAGRAVDEREKDPSVRLLLEEAAMNGRSVVISERQLNSWLTQTLLAEQEGRVAEKLAVDIMGVWVRLSEASGGRAEIVIEREVEGRPHTVSMYLRIEREKKGKQWVTYIHKDGGRFLGLVPLGGRFGKAKVPQGFLMLVKSSFENLAGAYAEELGWLEEEITRLGGGRIRIEENQLRIDFDNGDSVLSGSTS